MQFLVTMRPRTPAPPEMLIGMLDRAEAWHERYEAAFEAFGIFPGGGGFGVVNVRDEAELHRMLAEMPFTAFSDVELRPYVEGATGWRQTREAVAGMLASA